MVVTRDDVPVWPHPENFCVHSSSVEDDVVFLFTSLMLVSQYIATTEVGVSLLLYADTIDSLSLSCTRPCNCLGIVLILTLSLSLIIST